MKTPYNIEESLLEDLNESLDTTVSIVKGGGKITNIFNHPSKMVLEFKEYCKTKNRDFNEENTTPLKILFYFIKLVNIGIAVPGVKFCLDKLVFLSKNLVESREDIDKEEIYPIIYIL